MYVHIRVEVDLNVGSEVGRVLITYDDQSSIELEIDLQKVNYASKLI